MKKSIVLFFVLLWVSWPLLAQMPALSHPNDYQLVFFDEFTTPSLDWNVWESIDAISTSASGQKVGRWKENAVVENGNLKLRVLKGNRADSEWTAGYVYVKERFGSNTYYEARFKCTQATGVNNAFWTACNARDNGETRSFRDRYEIDVVEAKRLNAQQALTGHLAWHDWKTYAYTDGVDVAQGMSKTYNTIGYQTWGLWVGEDHFIIYCDGVEQWRGTTHASYPNQWKTGVGKLPIWYTNEEKRAYGKYGQSDWSYMGGMNGDDMNICFSTMPWSSSNSTLKDAAHNTSMDIDYVRVYKPKRELNKMPDQQLEVLSDGEELALITPFSLNVDKDYYFSVVAERSHAIPLTCDLLVGSSTFTTLRVTGDNELEISDEAGVVATHSAYPACEQVATHFGSGKKYLLVARVTAKAGGNDIVSFTSFELGKEIVPEKEPFLYRNIDERGNTSITNDWAINKKTSSHGVVSALRFKGNKGDGTFSSFRVASNYLAVVDPYLHKSNVTMWGECKSTTENRIYFQLNGKFPFSVTYSQGEEKVTVNNIPQSPYTFTVQPTKNTRYALLSATDGDGQEALVGGNASFFVNDNNFYKILPAFDTFLTEGTSGNAHTEKDIFVAAKSGSRQEGYYVFNFPDGVLPTSQANFLLYLTTKIPVDLSKISLWGSEEPISSAMTWATVSSQWELIESKILGAASGYYIDFDITTFCNRLLENNKKTFTLKISQMIGSQETVLKLKPGHNTTTSVPSYMVLKNEKVGSEHLSKLNNEMELFYDYSTHLLRVNNLSGVRKIELFDGTGRLVAMGEGVDIRVPQPFSGLLCVRVTTNFHCLTQKLFL